MTEQIRQTNIKGTINTTSNKTGKFKDNVRKTLYLNVTDQESLDKLGKLGITEYTSKDGERFFILKASEKITLWVDGKDEELDSSLTSNNFETKKDVGIAIISGTSEFGNEYHRVYALQLANRDDLTIKVKENPFL